MKERVKRLLCTLYVMPIKISCADLLISLSEIQLGKYGCSTLESVNSCEDQHAVCNSQRICECDTSFYDNNGADEFGKCTASKHFIFLCWL